MQENSKSLPMVSFAQAALLVSLSLLAPTAALAAGGFADARSMAVEQRNDNVSGIVVDENGEPLIGATVKQKGGSVGAITDMDGKFSVNLPAGTQLEVSYTGYQTQTLTARQGMKISMKTDAIGLDDVVVIGYGTQKKRDLTGSVTSMKNEDIVVAPTSNVMEALQGKVSGLDITKTSGETGGSVNILLRGSRSIYGSNTPLFIIDGLPGSYDDISPNDIESIDVLKDASSTAIYGSAGANGVIIITTKRGAKNHKTKVNFDAYYGWSGSPQYKHGMTGDEWTVYYTEAYKYKNGSYPTSMSDVFGGDKEAYEAYEKGKWIDWVDEATGNTATTQKYSLSIQGGNEKTNVYSSVVYNRDEGMLNNELRNKYQARLNVDHNIFSWLKVGLSSNLNYTIHDKGDNKTFTKSITSLPIGDVYDKDGNYQSEYVANYYSPLGDFIKNQYSNNTRTTYINSIGYAEIAPLKGLKFRTQLNATLSHSRLGRYWELTLTPTGQRMQEPLMRR